MLVTKKIKVGKTFVLALCLKLQDKSLIVIKGSKGFIMCGYLNLAAAQKASDVAIKIKGVSTIQDALRTTVHSCTSAASRLGIRKGQAIKEVLRIIA